MIAQKPYVGPTQQVSYNVQNATNTVLAGPAPGFVRIIEALAWSSSSINCTVGVTTPLTAGHGIYFSTESNLVVSLVLDSTTTLYAIGSATGGFLTVFYHDEALA